MILSRLDGSGTIVDLGVSLLGQCVCWVRIGFGGQRLKEKPVLLLVGRDDWQKDESLNVVLLDLFAKYHLQVAWEDPAAQVIYRLRQLQGKWPWLPAAIRLLVLRLVQVGYGLLHPSYFAYLYRQKRFGRSIPARCRHLQNVIHTLGEPERIIILSRSAGGRVSSLLADELNVRQLVCLGYPFKHPHSPEEPARYAHLAHISTPMLIIQGVRNRYGGQDVMSKYPLSAQVELFFVDTDHDFVMDHDLAETVVNKIASVVGLSTDASP